jgi:predicted metal-binding membrane protein
VTGSAQGAPRGWPWLAAAALAWLLLLGASRGLVSVGLCGVGRVDVWTAAKGTLAALLMVNSAGAMFAAWAAMLAAMTPPMIVPQIDHVVDRARVGSWFGGPAFVLGYAAVWLAAWAPLAALDLALRLILPADQVLVLLLAVGMLWQETPLKARALRRCHHRPPLRWRGLELARDAAGFGVRSGFWCLAACWPWMLVCLDGQGGLPLMVVIAILMWGERHASASPLRLSRIFPRLRGERRQSTTPFSRQSVGIGPSRS